MANISDMPAVTDRELLEQIARKVDELHAELDAFRPLLAMIRGGNGKPDMIGALQARRELRKAARGGP